MADDGADDFDRPDTPWAAQILNRVLSPIVPRLTRLDPEYLLSRASNTTGLDDFGGLGFHTPLAVLADSLQREAKLNAVGRFNASTQLLGLLQARLRVHDLLSRHPEILDSPVHTPIVILGMPRTGTTMLQRLLAQDLGLRHLPYWESLTPLPFGDLEPPLPDPDPRVRRAEQSLIALRWIAPRLIEMHEMAPNAPDEEIWLLAIDFATMLFEASYYVPSYGDWYERADLTESYGLLYRMLQILQWYRPGERWLLKSPQHLGQLGPLLAAFPDATIVQTHRDPVTVTASFANMVTYGQRINTDRPDPEVLGSYWAYRIETMLRRSVEDRPDGDERFVDIGFRELVGDPIGAVERVYSVAGRSLTAETRGRMEAWLKANPRGRHGVHTYRIEDFGIDPDERRRALRFYSRRFAVPDD